ncbi:MAG TPA: hypothetical protein VF609_03240 [Flavisolibacter sp.]
MVSCEVYLNMTDDCEAIAQMMSLDDEGEEDDDEEPVDNRQD